MSNTPEHEQDDALVASAQAGDLAAFEKLVVRHQKRMLNIALRIIGEYDDACEVTQDAFVSAWRNITGFRRQAKFSTWITAITLNLSRNRLRQLKVRQVRFPFSINAPIQTEDGELALDPPADDPSVLDQMEKRDVEASIRDCISALEPDFREVIVLRDLQDMAYEEIGAALSLVPGTVKSRLFRAREAVKECLKKALGESF